MRVRGTAGGGQAGSAGAPGLPRPRARAGRREARARPGAQQQPAVHQQGAGAAGAVPQAAGGRRRGRTGWRDWRAAAGGGGRRRHGWRRRPRDSGSGRMAERELVRLG